MRTGIDPRVGTALVLIPLVLGITLYGANWLFAGLCAIAVLAGVWEWAGLAEPAPASRKVLAQALTALVLATCYLGTGGVMTLYVAGVSLAWWMAALILVVRRRGGRKFSPGPLSRAGIGVVVLVPPWMCLVALHAHPGLEGPVLVTCLFIMIWAADTGAYYTGKKWGRRKLAVNVSPGKTLEGLLGAFAFGLFAASLCALALQMTLSGSMLFLLVCSGTIALSVIGDLTESMMKRSGGVKDSGELLPGHGGALDRIDSMTAAAPAFFVGIMLLERVL